MNRGFLAALAVVTLVGCGPSIPTGVVVKGKITKGGAPVTIAGASEGAGTINVLLLSTTRDAEGSAFGAPGTLDANGAFEITGSGKGIPPGKYRVQVSGDAGPGEDAFGGAYSGSNFLKEVDVPESSLGSSIDLGTMDLNDAPAGSQSN